MAQTWWETMEHLAFSLSLPLRMFFFVPFFFFEKNLNSIQQSVLRENEFAMKHNKMGKFDRNLHNHSLTADEALFSCNK